MSNKVLVVDDDEKLIELLTDFLSGYSYEVKSATLPSLADEVLKTWTPDIMILDLMMPEQNGFDYCRSLRENHTFPIIMLTAKGEVTDTVIGLEMGADDYMVKPFEPRELVARLRALLRRKPTSEQAQTTKDNIVKFNNTEINLAQESLTVEGKFVPTTYTEFQLLRILIKHKNTNVSRDQIMDELKGLEYQAYDRSIDVQISRLRAKLGDDAKHPKIIRTIRSKGYCFVMS